MSIYDKATSSSGSGSIYSSKTGSGSIYDKPKAEFSSDPLDEDINQQLRLLAEQNGFKEKKTFNALDAISRTLNVGTAISAGAVRGAMRDDTTIIQGITQGLKDNIGYADVIRDIVGTPETRGGKIAQGTAGFAADILFDPISYLSAGRVPAARTLVKGGVAVTEKVAKLSNLASKELRAGAMSRAEQFVAEGVDPIRAARLAESEAKRDINELFQRITSKDGLTVQNAEKFIDKGLNVKTAESIQQIGKALYDRGGLKFFGQTLVTSEQLAKTPIGQAARRLGETEIAQAFKNTLGRTFVYNFGKNKDVAEIMEKASYARRRSAVAISEAVDDLFKGTSEEEQVELFERVFKERLDVVENAKMIEEKHLKEFNEKFPGLKVKDKETAKQVLEGLEESTQKAVENIRKQVDEITQPFFEARAKEVTAGKTFAAKGAQVAEEGKIKSLARVDELTKMKDDLKRLLKEIRKSRKGGGNLSLKSGKELVVEMSDEEATRAINAMIDYQEERLTNEINDLADLARRLKGEPAKAGKGVKGSKKVSDIELMIIAEKKVKKLQDDLTQQSITLGKVLDAKRLAKEVMRGKRLEFPENEKLQRIADTLFEGDNSVVAKMAKLTGMSEADTYKIYLPSIFQDVTALKGFSKGLSSPRMDYLQEFKGAENEKLVKNAAEALKRGRIQVVTARLKSDAIKAMFKPGGIGKPLSDMTEAEAARLGFKKISRNLTDGKFEGWLPKSVHEDIINFLEPRSNAINDLAQVTGFDWATSLFKGYVTALFPSFHIRNMTSNQFQLMTKFGVDSLNPRFQGPATEMMVTMLRGKEMPNKFFITDAGEKISYKDIVKKIKAETDFLDEGAFSDMEQLLKTTRTKGSLNPASPDFVGLSAARKYGTMIENQSKLTGVLTALSKGQPIKEAVKQTEDALFNYRKLTDFERDVLRRVIPFYTFARKNFEFQLQSLTTTPGRIANQFKALNGIEESFGEPLGEDDKEGLPGWVLDRLGIKSGKGKYMTGFGLPIEEFVTRFSGDKGIIWNSITNTMTQMNPLIKYPIERATGVDIFRGKPITEITNGSGMKPILEALPKPVRKELEDYLQWKEVKVPRYVNGEKIGEYTKYTADPLALHFFRNIPTARLQSTIAYKDDEEKNRFELALQLATGVATYDIDKEYAQRMRDIEEKKELVDFLKRAGIIGTKEIIFEKTQ